MQRGGEGRPRPRRLDRLPEQYFAALLDRVAAAAADGGPPVVDLGRGNPEVGPPPHVVEALAGGGRRARTSTATRRSAACRALREAIARPLPRPTTASSSTRSARSRSCPGTKTAIVELALVLGRARRHDPAPRPVLPRLPLGDRARRAPTLGLVPLDPAAGWQPDLDAAPRRGRRASSTSPRTRAPSAPRPALFEAAVAYADRTGTAIVHDAAYIDLVFDGRAPESFLATPGREGRRRRAVDDVEDLRHGRLADRLRPRQRRDRRAGQPDRATTRASASSRRCSRRRSPRSRARRTASRSGAPTYERRRDRLVGGAARAAGLRGHLLRLAAAARRA